MNENIFKGKWLELKGDLQKNWGKLTESELDQTKGDMKSIGGLLQQKYGEAQESYGEKLSEIFKRFETKKDEKIADVKDALKK